MKVSKTTVRLMLLGVLLIGGLMLAKLRWVHPASRLVSAQTLPAEGADLTQQQWAYMPGAVPEKDGLRITDIGQAIVQQDGSGGQANPPVNLYGTHLSVSGDFHINATMSDIAGAAALQLYSKVPIIQDEFRVERPSIRLRVTGSTLNVSVWDGSIQPDLARSLPISSTDYTFTPAATVNLTLHRSAGQLAFAINDQYLGTVSESGIFKSGEVWFGADSTGNYLLSRLSAQANGRGRVQAVDTSTTKVTAQTTGKELQTLASKKRPGFTIGAAMALAPAVSDRQYASVAFGGQFGSMTTENALKWQFVHPKSETYDFNEAEALVNLAKRHNLTVHGHTLVFSEANPSWVQQLSVDTDTDKQLVKQTMTDHITRVLSHFKGRIPTWDVVNEPLADDDNSDQPLRDNKWYQAMGSDYISAAFTAAHQTDPDAKLFINEYGLETDGDRWDIFLDLITQLKAHGVPIDGVGFQAHVYEARDKIDPAMLRQHIQQLARLGLQARISEMDVYTDDGITVQAQQYAAVLNACISEPNCISWTTWGVSDRYDMYQDDAHKLQYGQDFLWDARMRPTNAVTQLQQTLL